MEKESKKTNLLKTSLLVLFLAFTLILFSINFAVAQENAQNSQESAIPSNLTTSVGSSDDSQDLNREEQQKEIQQEDAELNAGAGITPDSRFYFVEDQILSRFRDDADNREKKIAEIQEMVKEGNIDAARKSLEKYNEYADKLENEIDPQKIEKTKRSAAAIKNTLKRIESEIPEAEREEFVNEVVDKEKSIVTAAEIAGKIKELCESLSKIDPLEYSKVCKIEGDTPSWQKNLDKKLTKEQREEAEKFGKIMSECFKTSGQQCRCDEIPFTDFAKACSNAAPLATACEIRKDEKACDELDNLEMPELPLHLQDIFNKLESSISEARMDLHMPEECVAAGAKDPKECGKIMFKANAPEECVAAGLTGESRSDEKKCREIMESKKGEGEESKGPPRGFGPNCKSIQNSDERLKCYDGALSGVEEHFEDREQFREGFRDIKDKERECANSCSEKGGRWDFSGGQCKCFTDESRDDSPERREFQPPQEGFQQPPPNGEQFREGEQPPQIGTETQPSTEPSTSGGSEGSSNTISSGSEGEGGAVTGSVTGRIIAGNNFLEYYFN
jgi:flagellar motor protein MotB